MRTFWWGLTIGGPLIWLSLGLMLLDSLPILQPADHPLAAAALAILYFVGVAMMIAFPIATWRDR